MTPQADSPPPDDEKLAVETVTETTTDFEDNLAALFEENNFAKILSTAERFLENNVGDLIQRTFPLHSDITLPRTLPHGSQRPFLRVARIAVSTNVEMRNSGRADSFPVICIVYLKD